MSETVDQPPPPPSGEDWPARIEELLTEAEAAPSIGERANVLCRVAEIYERRLNDPNGALVTLVFTAKTISDAVTMRGTIDLTKSGSAAVSSATAGNPFKLDTKIQYTLREEVAAPGAYEVRWNGKDNDGRTSPSGIYFVSVKQGTESSQTRIVLAR